MHMVIFCLICKHGGTFLASPQNMFDFLTEPMSYAITLNGHDMQLVVKLPTAETCYVRKIVFSPLDLHFHYEDSTLYFPSLEHLVEHFHGHCLVVRTGMTTFQRIRLRRPVYNRVMSLKYSATVLLKRVKQEGQTFTFPDVPKIVEVRLARQNPYF